MNLYTQSKDPYWERIVYLYETKDDMSVQINNHEYLKLIIVSQGQGKLRCNDTVITFHSPALFCFAHNDDVELIDNYGIKNVTLFFKPETLNDSLSCETISELKQSEMRPTDWQDALMFDYYYGLDLPKKPYLPLNKEALTMLLRLLDKINMELIEQADGYWPCRSRSYFIEVLFCIKSIEDITEPQVLETINLEISQCQQLVNTIIEYLHEHIAQKHTLASLSKEFGVNRNIINRDFQSVTSDTVMNYLAKMRMEFASKLLKSTELPIQEIAIRSGYDDYTYFCRVFKKIYTLSPSRYRSN